VGREVMIYYAGTRVGSRWGMGTCKGPIGSDGIAITRFVTMRQVLSVGFHRRRPKVGARGEDR
jgi:hypothetical protein